MKTTLAKLLLAALAVTTTPLVTSAAADEISINVISAESGVIRSTKEAFLSLTVTEASQQAVAEFTARHVGDQVDIRVDGRSISKPVIREAMTHGPISFGLLSSEEEAKALADRLNSGTAKVEIEALSPQGHRE
jgi:preprotein translocase subunit SecD